MGSFFFFFGGGGGGGALNMHADQVSGSVENVAGLERNTFFFIHFLYTLEKIQTVT